jgi:hypothetical protein
MRLGFMDTPRPGTWRISEYARNWLADHPGATHLDRAPYESHNNKPRPTKDHAKAAPHSTHSRTISFVFAGRSYRLSKQEVIAAVRRAIGEGLPNEAHDYRTWAVEVDGVRLNLKWVFTLATGAPRNSFDSPTARRYLARLGIEAVPVQPERVARTPRRRIRDSVLVPPENGKIYRILDKEVSAIHQFLKGRADRPSDEKLCDWIHFCYTFDLVAEVGRLFAVIDPTQVNPWYFERTKRLARTCALRAEG